MRCPSCGSENLPDARFCGNCGVPLEARSGGGQSVIYCTDCGGENSPEARLCANCGAQMQAPPGRSRGIEAPQAQVAEFYVPVRLTIQYEFAEPAPWEQLITNRLLMIVKWLFAIPLYIIMAFYDLFASIATLIPS